MLSCSKLDKRGSQDTTVFAVKESQRRNKIDKKNMILFLSDVIKLKIKQENIWKNKQKFSNLTEKH